MATSMADQSGNESGGSTSALGIREGNGQMGYGSGGPSYALRTWGGSAMGAPRAYEDEDWDSVPHGLGIRAGYAMLPPSRAVASEVFDLGFGDMMGMDGPDGA